MLKAIHITDARPCLMRGESFSLADFELLCTLLSALKWQEFNGPIKLYADETALRFYEKEQMLGIWDGGVDTKSLEACTYDIDYRIFWAASKLIALQKEETPIVVIDTDMICWKKLQIPEHKLDSCICIHREDLYEGVYLSAEQLKIAAGYAFDPDWDWTTLPCNTAFVYHGNNALLTSYLEEAFRFMHNNKEQPAELISQMVFAEQRLLAMQAQKMGADLDALYRFDDLQNQDFFTHLWGYKQTLRCDAAKSYALCQRIANRLRQDYADRHPDLLRIPVLQRYLND